MPGGGGGAGSNPDSTEAIVSDSQSTQSLLDELALAEQYLFTHSNIGFFLTKCGGIVREGNGISPTKSRYWGEGRAEEKRPDFRLVTPANAPT